MFQFKALSPEGIGPALQRAERYRLLNEPREAESICRDILAIDPDNQQALVLLVLSLTEQFGDGDAPDVTEARSLLLKLNSEYERTYYAGMICERLAKELLAHGTLGSGPRVYDLLRDAMAWYEKAEHIRPPGNDDALLRWNTCARIILRNKLRPPPGPPGT
jgi:tetratricopeptide (TPR) repeat protein